MPRCFSFSPQIFYYSLYSCWKLWFLSSYWCDNFALRLKKKQFNLWNGYLSYFRRWGTVVSSFALLFWSSQCNIPLGRLCFIEIGTLVFFVKKPLHWVKKFLLLGSSYRGWKLLSIQWLIVQLLLLLESDGGSRGMACCHLQHYVLGEEGVEAIFHLRTFTKKICFTVESFCHWLEIFRSRDFSCSVGGSY